MTWENILKAKGFATQEGDKDDYATMARQIGNDLDYGDSTDMWLYTDDFTLEVEIKNVGSDTWSGGQEPKYHKDFKGSKERYRATESFGVHLTPKGEIKLMDGTIDKAIHTFKATDITIEEITAEVSGTNKTSSIYQIGVAYYIEDYDNGKLIIYPVLV